MNSATRLAFFLSVYVGLVTANGCSSYPAVSQFEEEAQKRQTVLDAIKAGGGTAESKHYEMLHKSGNAWAIKFPGQLTDDMIDLMPAMGNIAEIDFSKSSITNEQLLKIDGMKLGRICVNLDLSDTAISDEAFGALQNFYVLQKVNLKGSKVTKSGADAFKGNYNANPDVPAFVKKGLKFEL